jgi:hypothetical protein
VEKNGNEILRPKTNHTQQTERQPSEVTGRRVLMVVMIAISEY